MERVLHRPSADGTRLGRACSLQGCLPHGLRYHSTGYGNQVAISLPTRWATLVASGYIGADLRFFFGGETLSYYNQAGGLHAYSQRQLG